MIPINFETKVGSGFRLQSIVPSSHLEIISERWTERIASSLNQSIHLTINKLLTFFSLIEKKFIYHPFHYIELLNQHDNPINNYSVM